MNYAFKVELTTNYEEILPHVKFVSGWLLTFKTSSNELHALVHSRSLKMEFYSADGEPMGCVREARFSVIGKVVVENEAGKVIGWIKWGFRKDCLFSAEGHEIGSIKHASTKGLPVFLPPARTHLINRFELVHKTPEFDDRLIYAWICTKVWQEHHSS